MNIYAGIGSRIAPPDILKLLEVIGFKLAIKGYVLRSGGAMGPDTAFERGCDQYAGKKEIFYAHDADQQSKYFASQFHSGWDNCCDYVQNLHGRNAMIILGRKLDVPVKFVICWTPNGLDVGGTGVGIRMAQSKGITVVNLFHDEWRNRIHKFIEG